MFDPFTLTDNQAFLLFVAALDLILAAVAVQVFAAIWDR